MLSEREGDPGKDRAFEVRDLRSAEPLEAAGIVKRVRRLARRVIDFCGTARLSTVQSTNLYAFAEPSPTAHLLPVKRRIRNDAAHLVAKLAKAFSFRTGSAERPVTNSRGFQIGASTVETPVGACPVRGVVG
jgi:hypothetical protein